MADDCIFCKIRDGDIPGDFVHRDDDVMVIRDIAPKAPTHLLIIPNEHVVLGATVTPDHDARLGSMFRVAERVAELEGVAESGYRLAVNQGDDGGQVVDHLHMHLLGGRPLREMR